MNTGYNYITRANRGRRYPLDRDKLSAEARYLTTTCLQLRADNAVRRCRDQTEKAVHAFQRRTEPSVGCPEGWRDIAMYCIHSAGIADQHAEFYRTLVACRHAGVACDYLGLSYLEKSC